jgi:WD40 repeat protein
LWDTADWKQLLTVEFEDAFITCTAFNPDGTRLAVGAADGSIQIIDPISGKKQNKVQTSAHRVRRVLFGHNGKQMFSAGDDGRVRIWETQSWTLTRTIEAHRGAIYDMAVSPDGSLVATCGLEGIVRLWHTATGTIEGELKRKDIKDPRYPATGCLGFRPDGRRLAAGYEDTTLIIWDLKTGKQDRVLIGHKGTIRTLSYSPDGHHLATGAQDDTVIVWNADTGGEIASLKGHPNAIMSLAFSPNGKWLVSGGLLHRNTNVIGPERYQGPNLTLMLWKTELLDTVQTLRASDSTCWAVAFAPDSRSLAYTSGSTVNMIETASGRVFRALQGHSAEVLAIAYDKSGKMLVSGGSDKTIKVWDTDNGLESLTFRGHDAPVVSVAFSPLGPGSHVVSASIDGVIKLWDANTGKNVLDLGRHGKGMIRAAIGLNGTRIGSVSIDGTVRIWDAILGKESVRLGGHVQRETTLKGHGSLEDYPRVAIAFSSDGKHLATSSGDKNVILWNVLTGHEVITLKGHAIYVTSIAFSADGKRIVTGSCDATVRVWDLTTQGREILNIEGNDEFVESVAVSNDGRTLAAGNRNGCVKLWNCSPIP